MSFVVHRRPAHPSDHDVAGTRHSISPRQRFLIAAGLVALIVAAAFVGHHGRASAGPPTGTGVVLNAPIVGMASTPDGGGYWLVGADGGVFSYGNAGFYGSTASRTLNAPIVGMASTPDGGGYWLVGADGGVFAFGDAGFYGSTASRTLNAPIVGMASTPDGGGYWLVGADGGVFAFGDAGFYGSATGMSPTSSIVGLASTPDSGGYWEAASNGAVFSFGDAPYAGRAQATAGSVVGISADGPGYRLVASDGGVFDFGGATFYGSTAGQHLNRPMIGIASTGDGYLTVASDGGVFAFGGAGFFGSLGGSTVGALSALPFSLTGDGVTDFQRAAWARVNLCEEGGVWDVNGPVYSGGLGFSRANWTIFNTFGYPSSAALATPEQQIRVAIAFATRYWGNPNAAPDQQGCTGGY